MILLIGCHGFVLWEKLVNTIVVTNPEELLLLCRRHPLLLLLWPRGALTTITTKNSRLKAILLYNIQWPCYMLLSVK